MEKKHRSVNPTAQYQKKEEDQRRVFRSDGEKLIANLRRVKRVWAIALISPVALPEPIFSLFPVFLLA